MWTGALGRLISVRFVVDWQTAGWRILTMKAEGGIGRVPSSDAD
jgi:hypothetical protein